MTAVHILVLLVRSAVVLAQDSSIYDYAPALDSPCPTGSPNTSALVRGFTPQAQSLGPQEQAYVSARESTVIPRAWSDWLGDGSALGYDLSSFEGHLPRLAIAIGGRSLRAAQFGAGVLSALDARNDTAKNRGTGGLLQVASYLSSSSGGAWLAGGMVANDWPNPRDLVYGDGQGLSGWMLDMDLVAPSSISVHDVDNQDYWTSVLDSVSAKAESSMDTSMSDVWGRMVSYHFLNGTTRDNFFTNKTGHGAGQLWSRATRLFSYQNRSIPFPIIVANSISSNESSVSQDSVVYEITPEEFGSWDPRLSSMVTTAYVGTSLMNGRPTNTSACVSGFDQVSFIMGTSASIFDRSTDGPAGNFSGFDNESGDTSGMQFLYQQLSSRVQTRSQTVANWPNPFRGVGTSNFSDSGSQWLSLVDGGSNLEQVPFGSLLANARGVDVIVAVDASAEDPNRWPNGTSLLASSDRVSSLLSSSHQHFPPIPSSAQDFLSSGVTLRPTFFGCNPTVLPPDHPLIIYLPNSPPLDGSHPATNTDDMQLSYSPLFTAIFINQAYANALGGFLPNTTSPDPDWGRCLQCAALDRARLSIGPSTPPRSALCARCFDQYCYDPDAPPTVASIPGRSFVFVNPDPSGVTMVQRFFASHKALVIVGVLALVGVVAAAIAFIFWWRRRRERKKKYSRVDELREDDEPWKFYDSYQDSYKLGERRS